MTIVNGDTWTFKVRGQRFGALVEQEQQPDLSYLNLPENAQAKVAYENGEFQIMWLHVVALDEHDEGIENTEQTSDGLESWLSEDTFHEVARCVAGDICEETLLGPTPRKRMSEEQHSALREFVDWLDSQNTMPDIRSKFTAFLDDTYGTTQGY